MPEERSDILLVECIKMGFLFGKSFEHTMKEVRERWPNIDIEFCKGVYDNEKENGHWLMNSNIPTE